MSTLGFSCPKGVYWEGPSVGADELALGFCRDLLRKLFHAR